MGGAPSNQDWSGTNEEMAELMMPLYYVKNSTVVDEDITKAEACWRRILDASAPGYQDYVRLQGSGACDSATAWFTKTFYSRLFDVNPSATALFKGSAESQTKVLVAIVATALGQLRDPAGFHKTLETLAHVHVKRGVKGVQFGIAGDVLLWSFSVALKDDFTPELREIWVRLYSSMLKGLVPIAIGDERELYRQMKAQEKKAK
eukprot:gene7605-15579_t